MDNQTLFNLIITFSGVLGGWMLNIIWAAINDLKKEIDNLKKNQLLNTSN